MQITVGLLVALAGIASAAPPKPTTTPCLDYSICIDGMSDCGKPWGGCYNPCSQKSPTPAPCPTTPPPAPTSTVKSDDCRTRTICIDGINSCGMRYGGCVPDCKPHNIKVPTCPASATKTADKGNMAAWKREGGDMTAWKEDDGPMTIYESDGGRMTAWAPKPTQ